MKMLAFVNPLEVPVVVLSKSIVRAPDGRPGLCVGVGCAPTRALARLALARVTEAVASALYAAREAWPGSGELDLRPVLKGRRSPDSFDLVVLLDGIDGPDAERAARVVLEGAIAAL